MYSATSYDDGGDFDAFCEKCKEDFYEENEAMLDVWTDREYEIELDNYIWDMADGDGGEGDAKYDAMCDAQAEAGF